MTSFSVALWQGGHGAVAIHKFWAVRKIITCKFVLFFLVSEIKLCSVYFT